MTTAAGLGGRWRFRLRLPRAASFTLFPPPATTAFSHNCSFLLRLCGPVVFHLTLPSAAHSGRASQKPGASLAVATYWPRNSVQQRSFPAVRIKSIVLSVLMGCLALLLGSTPGGTPFPGDLQGRLPAGDFPGAAPDALRRGRLPADERVVVSEQGGAGASLPGTGRDGGPRDPHRWMDERFRLLDRDGDGLLSYEEMTENLKAEKDKWDANRDGQIDLIEWREYLAAVLAQQRLSAADASDRARPRGGLEQTRGQRARAPSRGRRELGTVPSPLRALGGNTPPGQNAPAGPPPQTIASLRGQVGKVFYFQ